MTQIYDFYNTGDDDFHSQNLTAWTAQSFTASGNYDIEYVELKLYRYVAQAPGIVTVSIRAAIGDMPTGPDLVAGTTDGDTLTTASAGEWRQITFSSPYSLVSGNAYAVCLRCTNVNFALRWRNDGSSPTYAGMASTSGDSGSTWTWAVTRDEMFETWGTLTGIAPTITDQSISQTITVGQAVVLSVTATGTPAPIYQWDMDGSPLSGETSDTLSFTAVGTSGGVYNCTATNVHGSDTTTDIVLSIAPVISSQSGDTASLLGTPTVLSVTATGYPIPTYQWYKNDALLSGEISTSISIYATYADAGTYKCTVTNAIGSVDSADIVLTVVANPYVYNFFDLPYDLNRGS